MINVHQHRQVQVNPSFYFYDQGRCVAVTPVFALGDSPHALISKIRRGVSAGDEVLELSYSFCLSVSN